MADRKVPFLKPVLHDLVRTILSNIKTVIKCDIFVLSLWDILKGVITYNVHVNSFNKVVKINLKSENALQLELTLSLNNGHSHLGKSCSYGYKSHFEKTPLNWTLHLQKPLIFLSVSSQLQLCTLNFSNPWSCPATMPLSDFQLSVNIIQVISPI